MSDKKFFLGFAAYLLASVCGTILFGSILFGFIVPIGLLMMMQIGEEMRKLWTQEA